jgi:NDP-sugar pyrophosphorylase family protein
VSLPVAILAGGLATRLGDVSKRIPKSLLEVAGKPFAEHQLALLRENGFGHVVFCVGHLGELMEDSLGDGSRWGMRLQYSYDRPTLLGTGGALRLALPLLGEAFFVLYGDSYLEGDYRKIEEGFLSSGKLGLMTVYRNLDRWDRSNVLYQNERILRYDKKNRTPEMQHIDYGIGILRAQVLEAYPAVRNFDLEIVYQELVAKDELAGFEVLERFYEIGSPAGLEETRAYLARKINHEGL